MKKTSILLSVAFLSLMVFVPGPTQSQKLKNKIHRKADKIANNYIVVLDEYVVGERGDFSIAPYIATEMAARHAGKIKHVYKHALNGFAVEMTEAEAVALSQDFRIKLVEEDGRVKASTTQTNPPWGLDRIDQRDLH